MLLLTPAPEAQTLPQPPQLEASVVGLMAQSLIEEEPQVMYGAVHTQFEFGQEPCPLHGGFVAQPGEGPEEK